MTALHDTYQAGIRCDAPGCPRALWQIGRSRALATTLALEAAHAAGWTLAADRLQGGRDLCQEHGGRP